MELVKYHFAGSYRTIAGIARLTGVSADTIRGRLKRGTSITDAVYDGHLQQRPQPKPDPIRTTRNNKKFYTFRGKTKTLPKWADELGISYNTLRERVYQHRWSVERAFTTPVMKGGSKRQRLQKRNAAIISRMVAGFEGAP